MKWLIIVLAVSLGLNVLGGYLLMRPKPTPKPQYIYITNQNTLPIIVHDTNINYEHQLGDVSYINSLIDELNLYHTNSFEVSNHTEGYAVVKLVKRECTIPLPKTIIYNAPKNIIGASFCLDNIYFASYSRLIFSFNDISIYGGVNIGLQVGKTGLFGVNANITF